MSVRLTTKLQKQEVSKDQRRKARVMEKEKAKRERERKRKRMCVACL